MTLAARDWASWKSIAERLIEDLEDAWEVLAEPIQTVMRRHGVPDSYEQLKELTRGKEGINRRTLHKFIDDLALPEAEKIRLREMTPQSYIGEAAALARKALKQLILGRYCPIYRLL